MTYVYDIFKSFVDPVFLIFILLLVAFFIVLISGKKKIGALFLFFVIILLYGLSTEPVSNYLSYQLEKEYIRPYPLENGSSLDVVVVLGGGVYDINVLNKSFLGQASIVRLVHAVRMYRLYHAGYLVCSGVGKEKVSNAALMAKLAEDLGVPKEKIRMEDKSKNTYEHAIEFNKIFSDKNMKIGLVTSAFHMKRSEKEFRKYFNSVVPLPAGYLYASSVGTPAVRFVPQSEWLFNNTLIFREYVGRFWYVVKDSLR